MNFDNLKDGTIYVLNKNEGIIAVFNKDDEDTLIDPIVDDIQNAESVLTFQVSATSQKWMDTYNPENLYLVNGKVYSANFTDSIERDRNDRDEDIITVKAYERQKLLEREYVRAWNSTTGFENIDEFMVVILSGGNLELQNNGVNVNSSHEKGTSGYALDGLLYGTGWVTGTCDVEGIYDLETDLENIYENILRVQELWGGIIVVDSLNKVIHHRDETKFLPYSGYEVRYQKNLQSSKYIGDNKIITELCPLGEGSLNIKSVNNNSVWLTNYSYTNSSLKSIENNDDIYEPEQLKAWGERKLQELCKPRRELTMTTAMLNEVEGYEHEEVHLNDIVDVIDFDFVEDRTVQLRVLEHQYYVWEGADAELTIGDITLESTDIFKKNVQATNLINNGTLDTSKVIDYYKNGKSLKEVLRQIDQVIIDTYSELTQADDQIRASVTQTITRIDNLTNDVVSQDRKISQLIINVEGIQSQVETLADLTNTLTGYYGRVVIPDAIKGDLLGLSVYGYNGAFVATFLGNDTYVSDDTYLAGNELTLITRTKNLCPTDQNYYKTGGAKYEDYASSTTLSLIEPLKVDENAELYFSFNAPGYYLKNIYFYNKYKEYVTDYNTIYSEDPIDETTTQNVAVTIPSNTPYINFDIRKYNAETEEFENIYPAEINTIKPQLEVSDRKTDFIECNTAEYSFDLGDELRAIEGAAYVDNIAPLQPLAAYEIGDFSTNSGEKTTSVNRVRTIGRVETGGKGSLYFVIEDDVFQFDNIFFYDEDGDYLGNYNTLNPNDKILGLTEKEVTVPNGTIYINYTFKKEDNDDIEEAEIASLDMQVRIKVTTADEFTIQDNYAYVIRRIGVDGQGNLYVLTTAETYDLGEANIPLVDGQNIIEVVRYTPKITTRYAIQSDYTTMFATSAQVATMIQQTDDKILLVAETKLTTDDLIKEFRSQILVTPYKILIEGNRIAIRSDYFTLTEDGHITATGGNIAGWTIAPSRLYKYRSGIVAGSTDSDIVFYAGADNGTTANTKFRVLNNGQTTVQLLHVECLNHDATAIDGIHVYEAGQLGMIVTPWGIKFVDTNDPSHDYILADFTRTSTENGVGIWLEQANNFGIYAGLGANTPLFEVSKTGYVYLRGSTTISGTLTVTGNGNLVTTSTDTGFGIRQITHNANTFYFHGLDGTTYSLSPSDRRMKKNIKDTEIDNALSLINKIKHHSFDWRANDKHEKIGFIANELYELDEGLAEEIPQGEDSKYNVLYGNNVTALLALSTKAIQELSKENEELKKKVESLEDKLIEIEKLLKGEK